MSERLVSPPGEDGAQWVVEFPSSGDRLRHEVRLLQGGVSTVWLASDEGDPASDWPPSPPLQQLLIESRRDGDVALLVGMAGRSHWSMSVEVAPGRLRFDVACRLREPPRQLGSRYLIREPAAGARLEAEPGSWVERSAETVTITPAEAGEATARWSYVVSIE